MGEVVDESRKFEVRNFCHFLHENQCETIVKKEKFTI